MVGSGAFSKIYLCEDLNDSNKEIAEEIALGNANNARQWVFKCRGRLAKLAAKHPLFANYFNHPI